MPLLINNFSNKILNMISFNLNKGGNLIILGANGVGKSTLSKVLSGIIPSSSVSIDGLNPSKVFGQKRRRLINYIPPKLEVFDSFMTVNDFLSLCPFSHDYSKEKVLKKLKINYIANKACHKLSSGESQLVLIASALLHHADYTIFDEPTANLDPQKIQNLFQVLKYEMPNKSKIIITHHLDLAYKLGFDILLLKNKSIVFHGSSEAFFDPKHLSLCYDGAVEKQGNNIVVKL
ncbi:Iron(III) dicitrate transport ATP-binding protein FecE (TC 3.A.1.14.1) [hydrothermal vent metagenome]|uniref:Iron(III) dicitrate transport ATP-binding protein FecE (TC 3.A.1.14.1) n=1 Tax=hydrothermal vent metagenome TaxID=652676 RepID=A0A1W1D179_9ZZZZ